MTDLKRNKLGQWDKGNNSGVRFTRENSLGNKHAIGNSPNRTSFVSGQFAMGKHPNWKGGIQKHKDAHYITLASNERVRLSRYVWEQEHGPLLSGYVIWHKDRNPFNDGLENLEAITRAELLSRNAH